MMQVVVQAPPSVPPVPVPPGIDPNFVFSQLMPLIGIVTIIVVGAIALRWVFKTPVGEAIAERIRGGKGAARRLSADHAHAELESRVDLLHDQVGEFAERLDFAERLLAERRERRVGPGE
jgi:hypothetical protein